MRPTKLIPLVPLLLFLFVTTRIFSQNPPNLAKNQCISINKPVYCSKPAENWTYLGALTDASDKTIFQVTGPVSFALQVDAQSTTSQDLILHWRANSWHDRDDNYKSFHHIKIYTSNNSTNGIDGTWQYVKDFTNHDKDNFVFFPNNHPKWVRIKEVDYTTISISRLEVFTSAPAGQKNNIWLFLGDSETKGAMGVGTTHYSAETYFSDQVLQDYECYYPIVINAGSGGEKTTEGAIAIQNILNEKPQISFVAFNYGINDVFLASPLLVPYDDPANDYGTMVFTNAYKSIINTCINKGAYPIPSRIPWVQFPNNYCFWVDQSGNQSNGISPINHNEIDPIIAQMTPYAIDPVTNLPYADFETWFHAHGTEYRVYRYDKVHFDRYGINKANQIWANTANEIVFSKQTNQCGSFNNTLNISCPNDMTIDLPGSQQSVSVSWNTPEVTSSCNSSSNSNLYLSSGQASGSYFSEGSFSISYTATNDCNMNQSCTFTVTVNASPNDNTASCGNIPNYTKMGEYNGHGYYLSESTQSWTSAKNLATAQGAYLTTISTQQENDFIKNHLNGNLAFIGFNDADNEGQFMWANGEPITLNLSGFNPASADYGIINFWNGNWQMANYQVAKKYVIEKECSSTSMLTLTCPNDLEVTLSNAAAQPIVNWPTPSATTTCNSSVTLNQISGQSIGSEFAVGTHTITYQASDACDNIDACSFQIVVSVQDAECPQNIPGFSSIGTLNNHFYFLSNSNKKWPEAATIAESHGGYLTTISSQEENDFIKNAVNSAVFIGINDADSENHLSWTNGEPVGFSNLATCSWCTNSSGKDFGELLPWANGTWSFNNQFVERPFVMEMDCDNPTDGNFSIICPDDIDAFVDGGQSSAAATWNTPTAINSCQNGNNVYYNQTSGMPSGSYFTLGQHTITYEGNNQCQQTAACEFTVTVVAQSAPCPNYIANFTKLGDFNNHSYYLSNASVKWPQARQLAQNAGGSLTTISSQAENEYLKQHLSETCFIGLTDAGQEGNLLWDNGEYLGYSNINTTCGWCGINSDYKDYSVLLPWNGLWGFEGPDTYRKFILEMACNANFTANSSSTASALQEQDGHTTTLARLFPNPTSGRLFINLITESRGSVKLDIFDTNGKRLLQEERNSEHGSNQYELDMSSFAKGIYFLHIVADKQVKVLRVTKN